MQLLSFNDFLLEKENKFNPADYNKKVYFLRKTEETENLSGDPRETVRKLNKEAWTELYDCIGTEDKGVMEKEIDDSMPVIYYGGNIPSALKYLEAKKLKEENMYNTPPPMLITGDKVKFHKVFDEYDFVPKTVFSLKEAKGLNFPVIAKPAEGHSGVGIEKFDTFEDLEKSKEKFDLYSEFVDFDREYRALYCKDKCIILNERITIEEENKDIRTKKANERVRFVYIEQDFDKFPHFNQLKEMVKGVKEKSPLGLYSIDFVIDKEDKAHLLEINSASGLGSAKLATVYEAVYEDFYKQKLPEEYKNYINERFIKPYHKINGEYKNEIKKSKYALDYNKIS